MNETSTGKIVRFEIDFDNPPPLTAEQKEELARLGAMRDEDIDFSDIPRQDGKGGWSRPGRLRDVIAKRAAEREGEAAGEGVVRLQADVLLFFKESGDASAERINAALREYMAGQRKSA